MGQMTHQRVRTRGSVRLPLRLIAALGLLPRKLRSPDSVAPPILASHCGRLPSWWCQRRSPVCAAARGARLLQRLPGLAPPPLDTQLILQRPGSIRDTGGASAVTQRGTGD